MDQLDGCKEKRPTHSGRALTFATLMAILIVVTLPYMIVAGYGASKLVETWYEDDPTPDDRFAKGYESLVVFGYNLGAMVYKVVLILLIILGMHWIYAPEISWSDDLRTTYQNWKEQRASYLEWKKQNPSEPPAPPH